MKRAVLFDVGDTLILGHPKFWLWPLLLERGLTPDTSRLREAIAAAYAEYNRRHLEAISPELALPVWRTFHRRLLEGLGLQDHAEEISSYLAENWQNPKVWPITPGAVEVLTELKKRGYKLGVVSNWDGLLPGVLEAVGLAPYFDYVAASALEGVAKPDPQIFRVVLHKLGVAPQEAVHIGDSPDDVSGAEAAGVTPLLLDPYRQNPQAIHDLREVLERV